MDNLYFKPTIDEIIEYQETSNAFFGEGCFHEVALRMWYSSFFEEEFEGGNE